MLNKNNLMMLFTAMYFLSCSVSVDNIASDSIISLKMCFFLLILMSATYMWLNNHLFSIK